MERFVDLHIHTSYSDGTFTPRQMTESAAAAGLAAAAVTDHDAVEGIAPAVEAAAQSGLEIVPGVELTAESDDFEVHVLGLLIDWDTPWFLEKLKLIRDRRSVRMEGMIRKLNDIGVDISREEVSALSSSCAAVGRLHLARALYEKGAVRSIGEAFTRYIGEENSCYVKRLKMTPEEIIRIIRGLKGIPLLAHPGILKRDEIIPRLAGAGLMGIEAYHTGHTPSATRYYKRLAKKYGLLVSGGSDCHGMGKGMPFIGTVKVPYEVLLRLKEAKRREFGG